MFLRYSDLNRRDDTTSCRSNILDVYFLRHPSYVNGKGFMKMLDLSDHNIGMMFFVFFLFFLLSFFFYEIWRYSYKNDILFYWVCCFIGFFPEKVRNASVEDVNGKLQGVE